MARVILAIALALVLSACNLVGAEPGIAVVERAIALQLTQTQEQLSQQLQLHTRPDVTVNQVSITNQTALTINDLPSYRVKGTCNYRIQLAKRNLAQQQIPFEVYLQRQKEDKIWRLAYPEINPAGQPTWTTYPILPAT